MAGIVDVRNLGKQYQVRTSSFAPTLREAIANGITAPFKRNGHNRVEEFWSLQDVSFEVQPGEVVGIVGRNGAGKSTLLKVLSRIVKPTVGEVDVYGRVGSLLEIGTGFHPDLTGRENVFLNGAIIGMGRAEIKRKFDEIVAFAEVEGFIDSAVRFYSSGMYLRLAFAVAAHFEPEILLLDEVLAVGDMAFQKKCLNKMRQASAQGRTVFFVSHNLDSITQFCDRAFLIDSGRLLEDGPTAAVNARYLQLLSEPATAS